MSRRLNGALLVGGNRDDQMLFALVAGDIEAWKLGEPSLLVRMAVATPSLSCR